jgi:hypothetical protein
MSENMVQQDLITKIVEKEEIITIATDSETIQEWSVDLVANVSAKFDSCY